MDAVTASEAGVSINDVDTTRSEVGSNNVDSVAGVSSNGELASAGELLTRMELDLACASEKLYNLNILMMHVATKESELELSDLEKDEKMGKSVGKALEFDFLSGFLDSELMQLDDFMNTFRKEIADVREFISSHELGSPYLKLEEKLADSEMSLEQFCEQVNELKAHSTMFQKVVSCFVKGEKGARENGEGFLTAGEFLNANAKTKMPTAEQEKHFLRMLEKSLARELDLDKKVAESKQIEEDLKLKLRSAEEVVFCLEEEMFDTLKRLFEADNSAEVLLGISKELLGRIQISQFNLNALTQREADLRSKLQNLEEQLKIKENNMRKSEIHSMEQIDSFAEEINSLKVSLKEAEEELDLANSEVSALREKVNLLEGKVKESEAKQLSADVAEDGSQNQLDTLHREITDKDNIILELKEKLSAAESMAESARERCKTLLDANLKLDEELSLRKHSGITPEKVQSLEKQLRESDILLQQAVVSAEASEEKQGMLYLSIKDMENIIEDLKWKVSKAENRADSAEDKCIILSESNAVLTEELSFLRGKLECIEGSLHQAEEAKLATAVDITSRTKLIAKLVMQLAVERERLHNQVSSLSKENKGLVVKLQQTNNGPTVLETTQDSPGSVLSSGHVFHSATPGMESKEEVIKEAATLEEVDENMQDEAAETDAKLPHSLPELEPVRRIDAGLLSFRHVSIAFMFVFIAGAVYFYQLEKCPF